MADCCSSVTLGLSLQVWSLEQPDWHCKIDEGSIGLVSSRWSPDGRHILNTTEFHVSVKLVRACVHAFMPPEVCSCICLSGFNCCWPARKGDLKIARHQSLSWPPLQPHPPGCMYSAWFHSSPPVSVLSDMSLKYLWNVGAMCMCPSNVSLVFSLAVSPINDDWT